MLERLGRFAHSSFYNVVLVIMFTIVNVIGYYYVGGTYFIEQWGGSIAATLGIGALVWKTQGYWFWSIVNASLWVVLFFDTHLPILGFLQVAYILFAIYGALQWAFVKFRIGYDHNVWTDNLGTVIALAICSYAVYYYWNIPGYTGSLWWFLEAGSVFIAIGANWMDAFKYKGNWVLWEMTNFLSIPLFWHEHLMVLVVFSFLWVAMDIPGYIHWFRVERKLASTGQVVLVGGSDVL